MASSESHLCDNCEEPATRRCAGCSRVWYCSKRCQEGVWVCHIFKCKVNNPIKTSYYLAQAARGDAFPEHAETLKDYGFKRVFTNADRSKLLGLYIGLFLYRDVHPRDVHRWRVKGTLVEEIKAAFEKSPVGSRGDYYPWFLANQYILDDSLPLPMTLEDRMKDNIIRAWKFTGGSGVYSLQQIEEEIRQQPKTRQACHELYRVLLFDPMSHPAPTMDSWVNFGFCTCRNSNDESAVGGLYHQLIERCTFDQFVAAYESGTLVKLIDSTGGMEDRLRLGLLAQLMYPPAKTMQTGDLEDFLGTGPLVRKSVWYLKQLVEVDLDVESNFRPPPSVGVGYGFMNCKNETEYADLKALYKQVLDMLGVHPPDLHEACIKGQLFEFVERYVTLNKKAAKKFRRLLRNPYPLSDVAMDCTMIFSFQ